MSTRPRGRASGSATIALFSARPSISGIDRSTSATANGSTRRSPRSAASRSAASPESGGRDGHAPGRSGTRTDTFRSVVVVVDDERSDAGEVRVGRRSCAGSSASGRPATRDREPERAAAPELAAHAAVAAHERDELAADREAEAGARRTGARSTCRPGRTAGRPAASLSGAMPSPVSETSKRIDRCRLPSASRSTTRTTISPACGELDRVADEVGQDLAHPTGVAADDCRARQRSTIATSSSPLACAGPASRSTTSSTMSRTSKSIVLDLELARLRPSRSRGCR